MNCAVVFTSRFPFKYGEESFFECELDGLCRNFDKVFIVACELREEAKTAYSLPENCEAFAVSRQSSVKEIIKFLPKFLFTKSLYSELKVMFQTKKFSLRNILPIYYALCSRDCINRGLKKLKYKLAGGFDEVYFLGYWFNFISVCAYEFSRQTVANKLRVFARAHGSADVKNEFREDRYYPFQKYLSERLDAVFCVSDKGREYLSSLYGDEKFHTAYIGTEIPNEMIKRDRKDFTVMSCSNVIPLKRVELIAQAMHLLADIDVKWVHYGAGELLEQIKQSCADIRDKVRFKGKVAHSEVLDILSSDVPSLFVSASASEGLPVSVIEAAAHGLPIISCDVGAVNEVVADGGNGTLLDRNTDASAIASQIRMYYNETDEQYLSQSALSQKIARIRFDSIECSKRLCELIKTL